FEIAALANAVSIEARDARVWKRFGDRLFDPLRTLADRFRGCETLRTHIDPRMLRAAVMAQERARPAMHGQMRIASFAMSGPAATRAKEHRRIAPAIQEQHDLSAGVEVPVHGEQRRRRNALRLCVPAQVDERPPRRLSP